MPINIRNISESHEGINSFDLDQHQGTYVNENTEETFISFLSGSTRYIQQIALNHSALRDGDRDGVLAFVEESEGTAWLPYTVGGTYYPKGWYIWDGIQWISSKSNVAAALDVAGGTGSIVQGDNVSLLTNDAGYTTFNGDYNNLTNKPTIFDGDYDSLTNKPEETDLDLELFYSELTYSSGDLTAIGYWNNSGKSTKYYTKTLTYTSGNLTSVVLYDNVNTNNVWTKTLSYDASGNLTNLTKS